MKTSLPLTAILALGLLTPTSGAQTTPDNPSVAVKPKPSATPAEQTPLQKTIEAYLRNLYAFGPEVQLTVSAPKETPIAGLLETSVSVKTGRARRMRSFTSAKTVNT